MSASSGSSPTMTQGLPYHDAAAAIEWLCRAFGCEKRLVVPAGNNRIAHANLVLGIWQP